MAVQFGSYSGYKDDDKDPGIVELELADGRKRRVPRGSDVAQMIMSGLDNRGYRQTLSDMGAEDNRLASAGDGLPFDLNQTFNTADPKKPRTKDDPTDRELAAAEGLQPGEYAVMNRGPGEAAKPSSSASDVAGINADGVPSSLARPVEQAAPPTDLQPQQLGRDYYVDPKTGKLMKVVAGQKGGKFETGGSMVREGGYDVDESYVNTLFEAHQQEMEALQDVEDIQVAKAESKRRIAQGEEIALSKQRDDQRIEESERRNETLKQKGLLELAQSDVDSWEENPDRIFDGEAGTWKRIGAAISVALGAVGAGLAGTPNFAQGIVDRAIDRDIAAQRAEYNKLKGKADNQYTRFIQAGADEEQAAELLRLTELGIVEKKAAAESARFEGQEAAARGQAFRSGVVTKFAKDMEQYLRMAGGKITERVNFVVQQARAGGPREATTAEKLELESKILTNAEKRLKLQGGGAQGSEAQKRQHALKAIQQEAQGLDMYPDDYEPPTTEGSWFGERWKRGVFDWAGGKGTAMGSLPEADRNAVQDFYRVQNSLAAFISVLHGQGAMAGREKQDYLEGISQAQTMGELKRTARKLQSDFR